MAGHLDTIKRVLDGNYEGATEEEKQTAIRELVQVCSVAAGAMTVQPFPFVDTVLIAPIQIAMVQGIGKIHGYKLDKKSILEMLSTFGASIVAQNVIMAAVKFIPFFGWVVTISMAYALTWAIGEVSNRYFASGRTLDDTELKSMFDTIYKEKKQEKAEQHKQNKTLRTRLEELKDARKQGLLTDEEFEKKKAEILADF
jgi:uncharacterized protein (DUF697 family)